MKSIIINERDNVGVALEPLPAGFVMEGEQGEFMVKETIPTGHKLALRDIDRGGTVMKYGFPIGHALSFIHAGEWVNERNMATNLQGVLHYDYTPQALPMVREPKGEATFMGYRRTDGGAGTRNELWIVPTVGCVNGIVTTLAQRLQRECDGKEGVDAIVPFTHNYGCSQLGDDHENTRKILCDIIRHPNAGGVLVVGLGCENNRMEVLRTLLGEYDTSRIRFMEVQHEGDELERGMELLHELLAIASRDVRERLRMSLLKVGLKCGGSDGLSGITANPLVGGFSDYLVAQGGSTLLTEVPEMFGAERLLMNRCRTRSTFDKCVAMINRFKEYYLNNGCPVGENPSPGNKEGGISTLEEKSLGCVQKGGSSPVEDVLEYGESLSHPGLNLLSAPGNDMVASTALAAAGCQLILFTTGRGTPLGSFVPTLKIASNTPLWEAKRNWMDMDAGPLVHGETMDHALERLVERVIATASGELTQNERNGYRDFAIFKNGVTL